MRYSKDFKDYELIDASNGEKLERWGNIILIRPEPQAIWNFPRKNPLWNKAHAVYHRSDKGGGYWEKRRHVPDVWSINYRNLTFNLKPMGFKHTGLFPEQAVNWDLMTEFIIESRRPLKILNLFSYTGGATVACLKAGASVTHVDASKGMVQWAKENAAASGVKEQPVRWLVDDCVKFVDREIRRGNKYDGIIMDPPSYGRGPDGEVWKLEQHISPLLIKISKLLSDDARFFLLNTYTAGISPTILDYLVKECVVKDRKGTVSTDEIGLKITDKNIVLPCGNTTVWHI